MQLGLRPMPKSSESAAVSPLTGRKSKREACKRWMEPHLLDQDALKGWKSACLWLIAQLDTFSYKGWLQTHKSKKNKAQVQFRGHRHPAIFATTTQNSRDRQERGKNKKISALSNHTKALAEKTSIVRKEVFYPMCSHIHASQLNIWLCALNATNIWSTIASSCDDVAIVFSLIHFLHKLWQFLIPYTHTHARTLWPHFSLLVSVPWHSGANLGWGGGWDSGNWWKQSHRINPVMSI